MIDSQDGSGKAGLPAGWLKLRASVASAGGAFDSVIFEDIHQLFLMQHVGEPPELAQLSREYGRDEVLQVVDQEGQPVWLENWVVDAIQQAAADDPAFLNWLRIATKDSGNALTSTDMSPAVSAPRLLVGRWLCHLAGLRHSTVEIFIDPPHLEGHTLVQVRGMDKFEAPGAFDIPCAGHADGLDGLAESLYKELAEELNLLTGDLDDLTLVARYNSNGVEQANGSINHEHRILYRARLKGQAASRICFTDGEVAGLAVFSVTELRTLAQHYPERIASGLSDALGYYD